MRYIVHCALCATLLVWVVGAPTAAAAASRTASQVVALGKAANGQVIEFEGEAIGEALRAGEGEAWVNLLSGEVALGVVMSEKDAASIPDFGRYQRIGSTVQVEGVYNVGCDTHGGEIDVHAMNVSVVAAGRGAPEEAALWQLGVAAALFAVAVASALRYGRARRDYAAG